MRFEWRKLVFFIAFCVAIIDTAFAQERSIEFIPRIGFSIGNSDISNELGLNLGGQLSIPIVQRFSIDPGVSFICMKSSAENMNTLLIPVYASYKIPIQQVNLDLKVGPCAQFTHSMDVGVSAEIGVVYQKWVMAVNGYLNFIDVKNKSLFSLSFGYKFYLK